MVFFELPMQFNSIRLSLIVSYRSVFLMLLFLLLFLNSVLWEWKMKVRKMMKWWFSFLFIVNRHLYESWPRLHGTVTIIIIYIWLWNRLYQHRLSRSRSYHMPMQSSSKRHDRSSSWLYQDRVMFMSNSYYIFGHYEYGQWILYGLGLWEPFTFFMNLLWFLEFESHFCC